MWVSVEEIDPDLYPTLDSYIAAWEPGPAEDWTNFQITSDQRIRATLPVEAHQFVYTYTTGGSSNLGVVNWYLLGTYQVSVAVDGDEATWLLDEYSQIRRTLEVVQESFHPAVYTSDTYGYSVALPPGWDVLEDPDLDYWAYDPGPGMPTVYVRVYSDSGYSDVSTYGDASSVQGGDIQSRGIVFTARPNPSYRMDYTYTDESTGKVVRGAVLVTLAGGNAIWVFVDDYAENWAEIQSVVDEVFLRVAVRE